MIEIVFSARAEGSLRYAQGWGQGPYSPSCVGFCWEPGEHKPGPLGQWLMKRRYHRREKAQWEHAVVLPGSGEDVFCLALGLSQGEIAPEHFWEHRRAFFADTELYLSPNHQQADKNAHRHLEKCRQSLAQVFQRVKGGEAMRIWYGSSAEDGCMLAWLAAQLADQQLTPKTLYLNQLPEQYPRPEGGAVSWISWGEVGPKQWGLLDQELRREAPEDFLSEQAALWHRLQRENTELRIAENGELRSVPADYYDDLIRQAVRRQPEEFNEAQLIGQLIGTQLRMPDVWIAQRIEVMIQAGQLVITWEENPGSRSYRRRLKKAAPTL